MFETKNFVGEDKDIIEIVSSNSAMGALKNFGMKNIRLCLPLVLSFGDLSDLDNYSRACLKELYKIDGYIPFLNGYDFKREIELLKEYAKDAKMIRVWSSHLNCDEYCLLLYICYLFPDKTISVVFAEELNWYCKTVGMTSPQEVEELIKREHILTRDEISDYLAKWKKIKDENSQLRHIVNGEVMGVTFDYFDKEILEYLCNCGEIRFIAFIGELTANSVIGDSVYSLYRYLIERLINDKKITLIEKNNTRYVKVS